MRSIKAKMILAMALAIVLISGTLSWIAIESARDSAILETGNTLKALAGKGAVVVEARLNGYFTYLHGLAGIRRLHDPHAELGVKMALLEEEAQTGPFDRIGLANIQGGLLYPDSSDTLRFMDISHMDFFQEILQGNDVMLPSIFGIDGEDEDGLIIVYAVPLYFEGQSSGALVAEGSMDFLSQIVDDLGFGETGYSYILDHEGTVIAHHRRELVQERYNPLEDAQQDDEIIHLAQLIERMLEEGTGTGDYVFNALNVRAGFAHVPGTDWLFAVVAEEKEILTTIRNLSSLLYGATIIILMIGVGVAALLGHSFSQPIIHMEQLFTRAAEGDLTVEAEIQSKDELGRASKSFNTMIEQIKKLTYYDRVTGLPNYQTLYIELGHSLQEKKSQVVTSGIEPMALFLFGSHDFRRINEQYGYQRENQILRQAAQRLQTQVESQGQLYRGQSDELFFLCYRDTLQQSIEDTARELKNIIEKPYTIGKERISIDFNAGVVLCPEHGDTADALLQNVEFAKNLAQITGKGTVEIFDKKIQSEVLEIRQLERDIYRALERQEMFLVYQPVITLEDGSIRGVEALLRWQHPQQGLISPGDFIPIAERSGSIHSIGRWVLREACRQYERWRQEGAQPLILQVNVSAKQFEYPGFLADVENILKETGIDPANLELELTESTFLRQVDEGIRRLQMLRDMGLRISIDDFGTGYSSLSYIAQLPADTLKIDSSFIQSIEEKKEARSIISAIIAMGHSLNLLLVAEGIEKEEQLQYLRHSYCKLGQGFYLHSPLVPDAIMPLLKTNSKSR